MSQAISRKKPVAAGGNRRPAGKAKPGRQTVKRGQAAPDGFADAASRFGGSVMNGSAALADYVWADRRRMGPWLIMLLAIFGTVMLFKTLANSQVMPLQRLEVVGQFKQLQVAQVVRAAKPHAQGGFFNVDLTDVRKAVEQLPWVATVQVDRVWPDALRIRVVEQNPYSLWRSPDGEPGLLNYDGVVFATGDAAAAYRNSAQQQQGAPELIGSAENGAALAVMYRRLLPTLGERLKTLELTDRGDWQLTLAAEGERTVELRLGPQPFASRLERFLKLQRSEPLAARLSDVAYMDMRYPHGAAVGWRQADLANVQ